MAAQRAAALCLAASLLALLLRVGHSAAAFQRSANAVEKVIQLLTDMSTAAKQEKKDEEVAFAKFATWCDMETKRLKAEVGKGEEELERLAAAVGKRTGEAEALGEEIAELRTTVAGAEANQKAAAAQRKKDHEAFLAASQDLAESVDALERAIEVLQEQNYDRPGGKAALVQLSDNERVPQRARTILAQFLVMLGTGEGSGDDGDDLMAYQAPEANAYEFQSGSVIGMLEKLRDDFRSKLGESQKEEMNSAHAHDMIMQDLKDSVENSERAIREKTSEKQRKAEKAASDKKQHAATLAVKEEDGKALQAAQAECTEKSASFNEKQKLRSQELEAMDKAVEILRTPEVQGTAQKYLSLAQLRAGSGPTALVQVAGRKDRRHVRDFLAGEGRRLNSQRLALLAEKLAADPFAKVTKLIYDMITKLQEEATTDADHEGFCDAELGKSKISRNKLTEDIDGLNAAVQEGKSTILALTEAIATLREEVTELVKALGEAEDMRHAEQAKNEQTVSDSMAAREAIAKAKVVLKDFYEKALTATALLQGTAAHRAGLKSRFVEMGSAEWRALANPNGTGAADAGHKEGMQTFGEVYRGQQDKAESGVLTLLEIIQSNFANLEASTVAAEAEAKKAFKEFSYESKKSISVKERKAEMNEADKAAAEERLRGDIAELKGTQDELLAADRYHAKLVPQCMDQGMTFEERTKAREAEVASLRQALQLLGGEGEGAAAAA